MRELWLDLTAAHARQRDQVRRERAVAWYTAALGRQRNMPSLADWLGDTAPQSPEGMRQMLQIIADATGWKIRTKES